MGRKPTKRTAYIGNGFVLVPSKEDPTFFERVDPRMLFYNCPVCDRPAGEKCVSRQNREVKWCHGDRTDDRYGRHVNFEERVEKGARLIEKGVFDEILIVETRAVLRKDKT